MQLLAEKVFNLNEIKEKHEIQEQGLQERFMFFFYCNYRVNHVNCHLSHVTNANRRSNQPSPFSQHAQQDAATDLDLEQKINFLCAVIYDHF